MGKSRFATYSDFFKNRDHHTPTELEILEWLPLLRAGDEIVAQNVIHGYMNIAIWTAGIACRRYNVWHPGRQEEIIACALSGLVQGVWRVGHGFMAEHNNLTGYLVTRIKGSIMDYFATLALIPIPSRSYRRGVGEPVKLVSLDALSEALEKWGDEAIVQIEEFGIDTKELQVAQYKEDDEELQQILKDNLNSFERQVILWRMDDWTDKDIASAIGSSNAYVNKVRKKIREKLSGVLNVHKVRCSSTGTPRPS